VDGGLPSDLSHLSSHSISSQPNLNSPLFSPSSVFLNTLKTNLFHFSPLVSRPKDYLSMDISGIDLALLLHLIGISILFILMSFSVLLCYLTYVVSENKYSLICFNCYRHFKSTPFHNVIYVHLISYFGSSSHCFLWNL
jgi:hypothetical protein